jgi:hypothetical protein
MPHEAMDNVITYILRFTSGIVSSKPTYVLEDLGYKA